FERLRRIKGKGASKSRRMNRRQANQLRGKINQHAKDKAFAQGVVTVEVNPHGTSQYCSRCGAKGERFSTLGGKRIKAKWGKLFECPVCHYQTNADYVEWISSVGCKLLVPSLPFLVSEGACFPFPAPRGKERYCQLLVPASG